MNKPYEAQYNHHRETTTLYFRGDSGEPFEEEYYMRGGVCWPLSHRIEGRLDMSGYIIMGGVNTRTGKVVVFEQRKFDIIENMFSNNVVQRIGLVSWLNNNWKTYYADTYYWNQGEETTKKYRLQIINSAMIEPKPYFVPVHWDNDDDALSDVWRYSKLGKEKFYPGKKFEENDQGEQVPSILYTQLAALKSGQKEIHPSVRALMCFVSGIERYPWLAPIKDPEPVLMFK